MFQIFQNYFSTVLLQGVEDNTELFFYLVPYVQK